MLFVVLLALICSTASAEVDVFIDRNYDFSMLKRIYVWPVKIESVPDNMKLSVTGLVEDGVDAQLKSKKMKSDILVKSTTRVWQDAQLLYGPFDYKQPFESAESEAFLFEKLGEGDICNAVLMTTVSLEEERKWREPRTETYITTERVRSVERRRRADGRYEEVEIFTDIPVTKERRIPGAWLVTVRGWCQAELYDTKNLTGKYVAAARAPFVKTYAEADESSPAKKLLRQSVDSAIASIFHKK